MFACPPPSYLFRKYKIVAHTMKHFKPKRLDDIYFGFCFCYGKKCSKLRITFSIKVWDQRSCPDALLQWHVELFAEYDFHCCYLVGNIIERLLAVSAVISMLS